MSGCGKQKTEKTHLRSGKPAELLYLPRVGKISYWGYLGLCAYARLKSRTVPIRLCSPSGEDKDEERRFLPEGSALDAAKRRSAGAGMPSAKKEICNDRRLPRFE